MLSMTVTFTLPARVDNLGQPLILNSPASCFNPSMSSRHRLFGNDAENVALEESKPQSKL